MGSRISKIWKTVYANDNTALIPELWANEALRNLDKNVVLLGMVHRDFENEVARFGDTVNAHRPSSFKARRKVDGDNVVPQDTNTANIPVLLDQHVYTSFIIHDGEESLSFKSLVEMYLERAVMSLIQAAERIVAGQVYEFMGNMVGQIGTALTSASVVSVREKMNQLLVPLEGRNLVVTAGGEADLLNVDKFVQANTVGDEGTAMRDASLGRKFGMNIWMSQNMPSIPTGNTVETGVAINEAAGYAAGTTGLTVDGGVTGLTAGDWCTVAGDDTPQLITAIDDPATSITISPGLRNAVVDDAVLTIYVGGAVDNAAGYAAGYTKQMAIDGFTVAPNLGQLVSFGTDAANLYSSMDVDTPLTELLLNRALGAALVNNQKVGIGPMGQYGFGFHKDAIAFVNRPLAIPRTNTGAAAAVANYNNLSVRVTIAYDPYQQGHLVTIDMLCGVKTLDTRLGVPLIS